MYCFIIGTTDTLVETIILPTTFKDNKQSKSDATNIKPWTRQEDMVLLQSIKKEYSENSFLLISEKLENRTIEQVIVSYFIFLYFACLIHIYVTKLYCKCR